MKNALCIIGLVLCIFVSSAAQAAISMNVPSGVTINALYISITPDGPVLGASYKKGDIIKINPTTGTSSLYFIHTVFNPNSADVDALDVLPNGNILLSTTTSATVGGLSFNYGDVVSYNPTTQVATMYFQGSTLIHCTNPNVQDVAVLSDGTLLFEISGGSSTFTMNEPVSGGTLTFDKNDIVAYKAGSDPYIYFNGDAKGITCGLDGLAVLCNGDLVLSFPTATTTPVVAQPEDLVLYDTSSNSFSIFLDSSTQLNYCGNIDAIDIDCTSSGQSQSAVPEPLSCTLFGLSILGGLSAYRRRKN